MTKLEELKEARDKAKSEYEAAEQALNLEESKDGKKDQLEDADFAETAGKILEQKEQG